MFGTNATRFQNANNTLNANPSSPPTFTHLKVRQKVSTDWLGIAVHCAQGSPLCSTANGGGPDAFPDEPGGYTGLHAGARLRFRSEQHERDDRHLRVEPRRRAAADHADPDGNRRPGREAAGPR